MKPTMLVGVMAVALSGFVGYHMVYVPQQGRARVIRTQIAARQADQHTRAEAAALLEQLERYRQRLPAEPDPSWLVNEVVALGQKAGVELTTISQDDPQSFQQFTRLSITLQFVATYHQLGQFLDALEQADHFIQVERLELGGSRDAPQGASGAGMVRLVLSTFYVPPVSMTPPSSAKPAVRSPANAGAGL